MMNLADHKKNKQPKQPKYYGRKMLIGRDEWLGFEALSLPMIKAKIDTGAKTSAIHAFNINYKKINGIDMVSFDVYPLQANRNLVVHCQEPVIDRRNIMSSNGHQEKRFVISSVMTLSDQCWPIQLTLSNRDPLKYRLLIGREALSSRVLIDPSLSCHQKNISSKEALVFYQSDG